MIVLYLQTSYFIIGIIITTMQDVLPVHRVATVVQVELLRLLQLLLLLRGPIARLQEITTNQSINQSTG